MRLRASGYLGERSIAAKEEKIRRMVRRLELSSADAEVWLGMLRQMLWKMKRPEMGNRQSNLHKIVFWLVSLGIS